MNQKKQNIAVEVKHLTKTFHIPLEAHNGLKQKLINTIKGRKGYREFTPLKNASFTVEEGDFFGIVGRNGSGKSTLLKTIAGIYNPNKGSVKVNGILVPFIELGVGFNPELTGRENVFLNGALLGFSRQEMADMYNDIVDFAELHDFMDERLKNYSSGMQVRLAFSIAIRADGDVLLLDEVLAVGDQAFQQKCFEYFGGLKQNNKTVILVTHDMNAVERFCTKALIINEGKIEAIGSSSEIAERYRNLFIKDSTAHVKEVAKEKEKKRDILKQPEYGVENIDVEVKQGNKNAMVVKPGEPFNIKVSVDTAKELSGVTVGINFKNSSGATMLARNTEDISYKGIDLKKGRNVVDFKVVENVYNDDTYSINAAVAIGDEFNRELIYQHVDIATFAVQGNRKKAVSVVYPKVDLKVE